MVLFRFDPPFPPFLPPSLPWRNIVNIYFFVGDLESISDVCALKLNVSIKGKSKPSLALSQFGLGVLGWGRGRAPTWQLFLVFLFCLFVFNIFWGFLLSEPSPTHF